MGDALEDLLPQAQLASERLGATWPQPASDDDWRSRLAVFQTDFLAPAQALLMRIELALASAPLAPAARWRSLLGQARNLLYDSEDNDNQAVVSWHKKTWWLIICGVILAVALAAALGHGVLLLLGATGGLLGRSMRMLGRQVLLTDLAAAWTTFFLSPVVGALAGWCGVLLVILGIEWKILGAAFETVSWTNPYAPLSLAVALLFGTSERLFVKVIDRLEEKLGMAQSAATDGSTKPATTPVKSLAITSEVLPSAGPGDYLQRLAAEGGTPPYTWKPKNPAELGPDFTLNADGVLRGKPTKSLTLKFAVVVTDATGASKEKVLTVETTAI